MTVFAPVALTAYHKSGVAAWFAVANPALQGFEAVVELNAQAARAVLAEWEDNLKGVLGSTNPVEFFTQQLNASQQAVGKAASYGRHLVEIVSNTGRLDEGHARSHAPAGSEAVVTAMNSALSTASAAAETMRAVTAQVIETAQSGLEAVAASTQNGKPASPRANSARKELAARETA
ncbi:hypothetical protein NLI96_g13309 [Meripilus lineatus]|uniref:Phasin domain-containing protein n=1 Tax=Meripilus lineatus TaxID=2056292 RepID=A0AAD5USZ7_9APHY|nr:hypothetical protein NLI96_g13309 [Physisporinus lineatus]